MSHRGRPLKGDEPRTVFRRMRLTQAEADALDRMEITFTELVRAFIVAKINSEDHFEKKKRQHLRKAS